MNTKFKVGTEFELNGDHFIVTEIGSHWIDYEYKDGREPGPEILMSFMPMSTAYMNSKLL